MKAHDAAAVRSGAGKALGNDRVDGLAKEAAQGANLTFTPDLRFADVVLFKDSSGAIILDLGQAINQLWWDQQRREGATRHTVLRWGGPGLECFLLPVPGSDDGVREMYIPGSPGYFEKSCPRARRGPGNSRSSC